MLPPSSVLRPSIPSNDSPSEGKWSLSKGSVASDNRNTTRIRVGAGNRDSNVDDKAIADTPGNRFFIQLDFELLESHMPFYQGALIDRLRYELTSNDYNRVIQGAGDADASCYICESCSGFDA